MRLTTVRVRPARREKLQEIGCEHGAFGCVEVSVFGETIAVGFHSSDDENMQVVWLKEGHDEQAVLALLVGYTTAVADATRAGLVPA